MCKSTSLFAFFFFNVIVKRFLLHQARLPQCSSGRMANVDPKHREDAHKPHNDGKEEAPATQ